MLFIVIMVVCLIYCAVVVSYAGISSSFAWFWLVAGVLSGLIYAVMRLAKKGVLIHKPPLWMTVSFWTTIAVGAALAVVVEILVIIGMFSQTNPSNLDYLIVLGAHVDGEVPTKSLQYRLDKAIEYLEKDEDLVVIVSGGKGSGENVSEAYAMARYLIGAGVSTKRIILENYSTNTRENLINSYEIIGDKNAAVGIVTNSFHVYRATSLAEKLGFDQAVGIAAPSDKLLLPNYMVREFFAIIKEKIMRYI